MTDRSPRRGLERPPRIHIRDLESAREMMARVYGDLVVDVPRDARRFEWRADPTDLGPLVVFSGAITTDVTLRGQPSGYTISLAAGSHAQAGSAGVTAEIVPGQRAAMFSPGARAQWSAEGPFTTTTVRIDPGYLEAQFEALTGVVIRRPIQFGLSLPTDAGAGAALERLCLFLAAEAQGTAPSFGNALVTTGLCETVTRALLMRQPHDHREALEAPAPLSSRSLVRIVEEYVDAHASEPIRMTDLTALVGVSMASIEATFRAYRGTSPMALLQKKRLSLARERLLSPEPGATVASVAHDSGFLFRERFEAAYTVAFGESPVETKRRGLLAVEPPPPVAPRRVTAIPPVDTATVFVVNGDLSQREAMAATLREAGHAVQEQAAPRAFLTAARAAGAGCAVIAIQLPELNGLEVAAALRDAGSTLPVVFTSADGDVMMAVKAMKAGAVDFLLAPVSKEPLLAAVTRALARDAEARAGRADRDALAARLSALSPREREVCLRVARGALNKQIAADLNIAESTVRIYRAGAMEKLGVTSAAELSTLLARLGGTAEAG